MRLILRCRIRWNFGDSRKGKADRPCIAVGRSAFVQLRPTLQPRVKSSLRITETSQTTSLTCPWLRAGRNNFAEAFARAGSLTCPWLRAGRNKVREFNAPIPSLTCPWLRAGRNNYLLRTFEEVSLTCPWLRAGRNVRSLGSPQETSLTCPWLIFVQSADLGFESDNTYYVN